MYNCSTCEVVKLQQKKIENLLKLIKIQEEKIKELKEGKWGVLMANEHNLQPVKNSEEAKRRGRNGGLASAEAYRRRKSLKEELLLLLSSKDLQKKISVALIDEAIKGNVKAYETIRDTIGEKPREQQELSMDAKIIVDYGD